MAVAAQKRYGHKIIHTSIISMSESVSDLLELAVLLKEVGLVDREGKGQLGDEDLAGPLEHPLLARR